MLDILLIIAALAVAILSLGGIINFNQHVDRRFGYRSCAQELGVTQKWRNT